MSQNSRAIVITASAGSGKTYTITQKFLEILLNSHDNEIFSSILAVTFTNKAAKEMKERVIKELTRRVLEENDRKALSVLKHILKNYSRLRIHTIDSFVYSIAKASAGFLNLTPEFNVRFDLKELSSDAFDRIIVKEDSVSVIREIVRICLQELGMKSGINPVNFLRDKVKEFIEKIYQHFTFDLSSEFRIDPPLEELRSALKEACQQIDVEEGAGKFYRALEKIIMSASPSMLVNTDVNIFNPEPYKKSSKSKNSKTQKAKELLSDRDADKLRDQLKAYTKLLTGIKFSQLIDLVREEMRLHLRHMGEVLLPEVYTLLEEKVKNMEYPNVAIYLGDSIRYVFIDEFQDTDPVQWYILKSMLISELLSSKEDALFLAVGDRKQAIFRFRGGDSTIFDELLKDGIDGHRVKEGEPLTDNYRSLQAILDFVKDVFSPENLEENLRKAFRSSSQKVVDPLYELVLNKVREKWSFDKSVHQRAKRGSSDTPGYVKVEPIKVPTRKSQNSQQPKKSKEDLVKEKFFETLEDLLNRGWRKRDIATLVRRNSEVNLISRWCLERGIPVASNVTWDVRNHPVVKELIALLAFINDPKDVVSFTSFILGDLINYKTGAEKEFTHLLEELSISRDTGSLLKRFQEKFPNVWNDHIKPFLSMGPYRTPYEIISMAGKHFSDYFQDHPEAGPFFYHFLEVTLKASSSGKTGLDEFLKWIRNGPADTFLLNLPEYGDAITVTTVHQAKGLAYNVVIVPFGEIGKSATSIQKFTYVKKYNVFSPSIEKKLATSVDEMGKLFVEEVSNSILDELNLFYVAATRARFELHIFNIFSSQSKPLPIPSGDGRAEWGKKLPADSVLSQYRGDEEEKNPSAYIKFTPPRGKGTLANLVRARKDLILEGEKWLAALRGELMHQAMALVGKLSEENWQEEISKAVKTAAEEKHFTQDTGEVAEVLFSFFKTSEHRRLLQGDPILLEENVCDSSGNIYRPDRVQKRDGAVEVIEFKTGEEPREEHITQVKQYIKLLSQIYPREKIRGFIAYLDVNKVEEVQ